MTGLVPIGCRIAPILMLALAFVISTACGNSPATESGTSTELPPSSSTADSQPLVASATETSATGTPEPSSSLRDSPTEPPEPTANSVPVASTEAATSYERDREPAVPSGPASPPQNPTPMPPADAGPVADLMLAAFEQVLFDIYESSLPSVVYIRVPNPGASSLRDVPGVPDELLWGTGSGFVWDEEGHIITNHHVVEGIEPGSGDVTIIFADSTQARARVIGSDPHSDLAVIKLNDGDWELDPVTLGDSDTVRVGQLTVAIGAPFGQEFTMTSGIVSALGRNISSQGQFSIPEVIQTDAAINPGNSGGPLLDRDGHVIGINTQIISRSGNFSGVGMAVPVNIAKRVVPPLIEDGQFNYPWLGVSIATVSSLYVDELELPEGLRGALVVSVVENSPAYRAGLHGSGDTVDLDGIEYPSGGDIIVAIGSHEITSSNDLIAHLTYYNSPEDTVTLSILRNGQPLSVEVTLGQRPDTP